MTPVAAQLGYFEGGWGDPAAFLASRHTRARLFKFRCLDQFLKSRRIMGTDVQICTFLKNKEYLFNP